MDPLWGQLLLQVILILINAFFAATEIAVISLNDGVLKKQADGGDKIAQKMMKLVESPSKFLSTIQIGITLAGFLGSAFAASNFSERLVNWLVKGLHFTALSRAALTNITVILITLILSYFTLVFGELVPKRIAMQKSEQLARRVCGTITFLAKVLKPVVWVMSASTNGILRLIGLNPNEESDTYSEEEIRMMIDIGEEKGTIEPTERELIDNIFEFNNTTAEDVMVHRTDMIVLWADDSDEDIIKTILESGLSRFPVCGEDADDIIGVLRTREYLLNKQSKQPKPLSELLSTPYFVPETVRTDILFRDMQARKVHMSLVIDEYGGISGIVTMEDLLEEIVGNIFDESDPLDEKEINKIGENLWRIAGSASIEQIAEELSVDMGDPEEQDYDTLGGLVFSCFSHIPEDGAQPELDVCGLHIKVEKIAERRVEWALVSVLPKPAKDDSEE